MITITDIEFKKLVTFVQSKYGINLEKKRVLVEGRLSNVISEKGLKTFEDYFKILFNDKSEVEMTTLLNKITTNHTFFMRENEHFDFMLDVALPKLVAAHAGTRSLKIWSAGCSSGQEAYTTAMTIDNFFKGNKGDWDTTILATDISQQVMDKAKTATYSIDGLKDIPPEWQKKYTKDNKNGTFTMVDRIKNEVVYRPFNLMDPFIFNNKRPFDIIFCRNVMIYFDAPTKDKLIEKFYSVTAKGGYLFIGHSENVNREATKYNYVKPAIYQK